MPEFLLVLLKELIIPLVALVLTPIVAGLVNRAIQAFERRTDLEFTKEQERQFDKIAREAVHYAEEQASKALSGEETDVEQIVSGKQKMESAISYAKRRLQKMGMDKHLQQGADHLAEIIEAKLFEERLKHGDKKTKKLKGTPLSDLDLSSRIQTELQDGGINTVEGLRSKTDNELTAIDGIGEKYLKKIKAALDEASESEGGGS